MFYRAPRGSGGWPSPHLHFGAVLEPRGHGGSGGQQVQVQLFLHARQRVAGSLSVSVRHRHSLPSPADDLHPPTTPTPLALGVSSGPLLLRLLLLPPARCGAAQTVTATYRPRRRTAL